MEKYKFSSVGLLAPLIPNKMLFRKGDKKYN